MADQAAEQPLDAVMRQASVHTTVTAPSQLVEPWQAMKTSVASLLRTSSSEAGWLGAFRQLAERMRLLAAQDTDVALYMMLQTASGEFDHYSAHHAMFCTVVAELCARWLEWTEAEIDSLAHAALTMNVGMTAMQDAMSRHTATLSPAQREIIDAHPGRSAELLAEAGVDDPLWLEAVRRHHRPLLEGESGDPLQPAQKLAQLLQRADVFTAKLSRRKTREGASATVAARDACLDAAGLPDAIGATILRTLGLYPPGTYVRLANGELGVVIRRGEKAHTPVVACLRRPDGSTLAVPQRRDTRDARHAVRRGILGSELKMTFSHGRVLDAR